MHHRFHSRLWSSRKLEIGPRSQLFATLVWIPRNFVRRFCIMDRVAVLPRLSLCVLLLLSLGQYHGAHGSRMLRAGVQGQLPPCKDVPGGIQNWDCYDPPSTPLAPCDFKHHSPGIDCNTDGQKPPAPKAKLADISGAGGASTHAVIQGQLPPCKDVPGGIQNWDCYDPPSTPLPPCDFKHHSPGIDCNTDGQKPPAPKAKLADISGAGGASTHAVIQGQLPPCKDFPGGIQNWDCYDPPRTPLPPCDFKHHSPGIDCNTDGQKPPSPKAKLAVTDIYSRAGGASTHHGVQGQLPPCKDVPGGIQNWDCYDPPNTPLPPCDFKHQSPGIDCNTDGQKPPSPKAKLAVADIAGAGGACAGLDC